MMQQQQQQQQQQHNTTTECHSNGISGPGQMAVKEIFDADYRHLHAVPEPRISHMPPAHLNITRLVVCKNYTPHMPGSCAMSTTCKFVHVDGRLDEFPAQTVHVNYAWRSLAAVTYARPPAGVMLAVTQPNNRMPCEVVASERVLLTRGVTAHMQMQPQQRAQHALSHCAHYYLNRTCLRGEDCYFVHTIHIDEKAAPFQRAPNRLRSITHTTNGDASGPAPVVTAESPSNAEQQRGNLVVPLTIRIDSVPVTAALSTTARTAVLPPPITIASKPMFSLQPVVAGGHEAALPTSVSTPTCNRSGGAFAAVRGAAFPPSPLMLGGGHSGVDDFSVDVTDMPGISASIEPPEMSHDDIGHPAAQHSAAAAISAQGLPRFASLSALRSSTTPEPPVSTSASSVAGSGEACIAGLEKRSASVSLAELPAAVPAGAAFVHVHDPYDCTKPLRVWVEPLLQ